MSAVNSSADGQNAAISINLTPPNSTPASYPNTAHRSAAIPNVSNIFVSGGTIQNLATQVPRSGGDSAGSLGGVKSGTVSGVSRNMIGSKSVLVHAMPLTSMLHPTLQNNENTIGMSVTPSQLMLFSFT